MHVTSVLPSHPGTENATAPPLTTLVTWNTRASAPEITCSERALLFRMVTTLIAAPLQMKVRTSERHRDLLGGVRHVVRAAASRYGQLVFTDTPPGCHTSHPPSIRVPREPRSEREQEGPRHGREREHLLDGEAAEVAEDDHADS